MEPEHPPAAGTPRTDELLAAERERLVVTLRSVGDAVVVTDENGRITHLNEVAERLTGWTSGESVGRPVGEVFRIVSEATRERCVDPVARVLRDGAVVGLANHTLLVARDGTERPISDSGSPIRDRDGRLVGAVLVFRDQTGERAAARAIRESEARYRDLVQLSPDAIFVVQGGRIVFANAACLELFGAAREDEVIGRTLYDFIDPAFHASVRARAAAVLGGATAPLITERIVRLDGSMRDVEAVAAPLQRQGAPAIHVVLRDVTPRTRAEADRERLRTQLAEVQKLDGVGRLAGGIAHDFNNILTVVLSCAEALRADLRDGVAPAGEDVEEILSAGQRARDLTRQLLAFARKQIIAPVHLDVNAVVEGLAKMLERALGEDIALVVRPAPDLWPVRCDPSQLEQVILNLAVNARDAMPAGGRLVLETQNLEADPEHPGGGPGPWVCLSVSDTGIGMTDEVKAHLFEPFFTTKPRGKGTGLGLATSYGIIRQSGGHVHVESAPGRGAVFRVCLPREDGTVAAMAAEVAEAAEVAGRGSETICLVEDDPQVRAVTARALRGAGYRVLVAGAGEEAVGLLSEGGEEMHLLVTDVVMPGMNGRAVADAFCDRHARIRVLFVSGYPQDAIAHHGVLDSGIEFLQKPFTPSALLARVRALLDAC